VGRDGILRGVGNPAVQARKNVLRTPEPQSQDLMRVALVHYWLLGSRGGEKVLEAICRLLPDADIFTLFYDPARVSPLIRSKNVHASFLNPLKRFHRGMLPLMPLALESFDLRSYDLVVSSESGPAKGVLTSSTSRHLCYCHSPMRYLWELYPAYMNDFRTNPIMRALMAPVSSYLRTWDYSTAARVDHFVANSWNVRRRIWRTYRRKAKVVHPPVAIDTFYHHRSDGYFLMVAEMVAYKRLDYAIRTFARLGRKLKIVGDGPQYSALKKLAAPNIEFCGRVSDQELHDLYSRSSALVVPGEEDFGITMVESLASGKPVVALGRGGSVEIVREKCGVLYQDSTETGLTDALRAFDRMEPSFNPLFLRTAVGEFSESVFERNFGAALTRLVGREVAAEAPKSEFTRSLQAPYDTRSARPL
jgi:glycosyltransferase involved in cell wall biosynthesis